MMKTLLGALCFLALISCKDNNGKDTVALDADADKTEITSVPTYNYDGLRPFLEKEDGKVHVINFWATWCKPCVEELPHFEKLNAESDTDKMDVTLVSLDMPTMVDSHLIPFIEKNELKSEVVLLDDPDSNYWIRQIDKNWSGAIPATIIYKDGQRKFYEKSFTYNELQQELKTFL